jgi:hypothetical protein
MSFLKKPEPGKLYKKELPKVGITPKPGEYTEYEEKLSFFQVIMRGLLKEEMEPKYYKKYDNFIYNFKVYTLTAVFGIGMFYTLFHSPFMSGKATEVYEDTWFDKSLDVVLNFLSDQWEALNHNLKTLF